MASTEISAVELRCNACWRSIGAGAGSRAYKTPCSHLFCRGCSERYFSRKLTCPLCSVEFASGDAISELAVERSAEAAAATFAFAAFHSEEALRVVGDALAFARAQTALYGTREVWCKTRDADSLTRRLVEAENKARSMAAELEKAARDSADLGARLERAMHEAHEERRRRKCARG